MKMLFVIEATIIISISLVRRGSKLGESFCLNPRLMAVDSTLIMTLLPLIKAAVLRLQKKFQELVSLQPLPDITVLTNTYRLDHHRSDFSSRICTTVIAL
jgi:hypothetical protein